jgi:hypothetical protein
LRQLFDAILSGNILVQMVVLKCHGKITWWAMWTATSRYRLWMAGALSSSASDAGTSYRQRKPSPVMTDSGSFSLM